jgi:hypothetical protein
MQARSVVLSSVVLALACATRPLAEEQGGASDGDATGETDATTDGGGDGDGDDGGESCSCIVSEDLICASSTRPMALDDCDVPDPCDLVDSDVPSEEVATCVLQLLIDQDQPSRFDYIAHVPGSWGDDTYVGSFFVLGPGTGIDLECVHLSYDCCSPPPPAITPSFHSIREPAYFEDCLGKTASVMTGCIFNGLEMLDYVPACGEP